MNCIYACCLFLLFSYFLFLSLSSLCVCLSCYFLAVTGWASKSSVPKDIYHNQYTTAASSCPILATTTDRGGVSGEEADCRSHRCRQWTRVRFVFLYLFISGFPCSFLCLHGSLSNADAENARAARTSHTTCHAASLSLSLSPSLILSLFPAACANSSIMKLCLQWQRRA